MCWTTIVNQMATIETLNNEKVNRTPNNNNNNNNNDNNSNNYIIIVILFMIIIFTGEGRRRGLHV